MWTCGTCGAELKSPCKKCPHGKHVTGLPSNVWLAAADEPNLEERFLSCIRPAENDELMETRLHKYVRILRDNLSVSINLHPESLINFMHDERIRYVNLHDNLRANAIPGYDKELASKRSAIDEMAFKYDGQRLNFGAVNLGDNVGLISYGAACIILRSEDIKNRVSFLENNVFSYYNESGGAISFNIPSGSRALWDTVPKLAIIKLNTALFEPAEITCEELSSLLLLSEGDKATDRYIEAQIFPPIHRATISKIVLSMNAWRQVNATGLVGKTAQHMQELIAKRWQNFLNYMNDEVEDNLPGVEMQVMGDATAT